MAADSVVVGIHLSGGARRDNQEQVSRVWFAPPNRWRIQGDDEHRSVDLSDGNQRWQGLTGFVTERGRDPDLASTGHLGKLLLPGPYLGLFTFDEVADTERAGRHCLHAVARPRDPSGIRGLVRLEMLMVGMAGLEHRFWFDAAYGFVIRHEGLIDGQPAVVTELTDLVVDEPLGPERFQLPEGTTVQTEAEERIRHLERLGVDTTALDISDPVAVQEAMREATETGPHGRPTLDDRVREHVPWGPPPGDVQEAKAAVTAAFAAFGATSPDGRDLPNVHAGHGLAPLLARARQRLAGATADNTTATVDAIRFLGPDQAAVWFSIEVAGRRTPVSQRHGRAVRLDGRWLIEHATLADLLSLGGVRAPAPEDRNTTD